MMDVSCAFTGHRPKRFSFGSIESDERCVRLKAVLKDTIVALIDSGMRMFYTGMALGADQWAAEIVLDLKAGRNDLYLAAILPCATQADTWLKKERERYHGILERCDDVKTLSQSYTRACMYERDRFLVDCAGFILAVFDGNNSGGTAYTIGHAKEKDRKIITIHPDTLAVEYPAGFAMPGEVSRGKVIPITEFKQKP